MNSQEEAPWHIRSSGSGRSRSSASRERARPAWPRRCSPRRERSPPRGSVERGTTVCDYTPLEKQLQHSLKLAVASFELRKQRSSPARHAGLPRFPRPRAARARGGRDRGDRDQRAERHRDDDRPLHAVGAAKRGLDRLIIVNKIDADNVDLRGPARAHPAGVRQGMPAAQPAGRQARARSRTASSRPRARPTSRSVEEAHRKLVDQVVEVDEKLMEKYLEKGEVTPEELHEPLERAMREGHLIPVVFTSAKTGAGIAELLDVIVKLLPNPDRGQSARLREHRRAAASAASCTPVPDPGKHVLAHVFKIEIDPYIGRLAVFRVHQGRLTPGTQLYIGEGRKPIKPGHLYLLRGKTQIEVQRGDARRHLRHRQDRRDPVRPHPARLGRGRARARPAARAADVGVRPRGAAEEARRRAEGVRRAAQDHGRGSVLPHRAQRAGERDGDARPGRDAPARRCSRRWRRSTSSSSTRGRRRSLSARPSRPRPRATAATRSRPAAPASSARCSSRSSRCRAARASSSSTP